MSVRIGVDLGGTKIEAVALADDGRELARRRVATPAGDYAGTVRAVARLVEDFESRLGLKGSVGVAIPGALSPATGMVKNANSVCLIGQPLDRDLTAALGRAVRIANDANCFALSEAVDGGAAGAAVVFGVIVGTGTGGGLVIDGRVIGGANAIAGEWGHNPLPWPDDRERPGARCYCGQNGCIETFLSGPGLARDHCSATGRELEPPEIVARAAAGEADARATLERYEGRMAKALASVINLLDPEVIVLGGGLSNIERLYEAVPARWGAWVFSDQVSTRLEKARHGDSSGVRGAAWLWPAGGDAG
ncbi:MAG: ROK family protein [Alphaproteobacteria bacterium]|nr:ROK family protein [Alphaproteobacteria bacterium]